MARINVEDEFWIDIMSIAVKMGDEDKAIGQALRLFRLAQSKIKQNKIITDQDWISGKFSDLLIPTFAKKIDGGYEVVGASEHFRWLRDRIEAGKNGGLSKSQDKLKHLKQFSKKQEINNLAPKQTEAKPKPLTLTLPLTLPLSQSLTQNNSNSSSTVAVKNTARVAIETFETENDLFNSIPIKTKDRWISLYEMPYLQRETLKAFNYYENNPRKKPKNIKGWIQALSSWFERGWPHYVKNIAGQKKSGIEEWAEEMAKKEKDGL